MSYGFLAQQEDLRENWPYRILFGAHEGKVPPTRPEEYHFAMQHIPESGIIFDAACGWVPEWHILDYILADEGRAVLAYDLNPEHIYRCRPNPNIIRMLGDVCSIPFADNSFPTVLFISTLEHLPESYAERALAELSRVCFGTFIVTFDKFDPQSFKEVLEYYGFDLGERVDQEGELLDPRVGYIVAHK